MTPLGLRDILDINGTIYQVFVSSFVLQNGGANVYNLVGKPLWRGCGGFPCSELPVSKEISLVTYDATADLTSITFDPRSQSTNHIFLDRGCSNNKCFASFLFPHVYFKGLSAHIVTLGIAKNCHQLSLRHLDVFPQIFNSNPYYSAQIRR